MKNVYLYPAVIGLLGLAAAGLAQTTTSIPKSTVLCDASVCQTDQQPVPEQPDEGSGLKEETHQTGPIVHPWKFKVGHRKTEVIKGVEYESKERKGEVNLTVNSDGSWNFSGTFPAIPDHDVDIVMGIKSKQGSIVLFRFAGGIDNGAQFNKTGTSQTLKDNFQAFEDHKWYANYRTPLSKEGIAKRYEERKKKKEEMKDEERAKDEAKEKKQAARQAAEAARQRSRQQQGGGRSNGGGGIGGAISSAVSTVGDVTNTLLNGAAAAGNAVVNGVEDIGNAILSIF